jgi:hypothetical protein
MYLFATPTGLKSWRFNYMFQGKNFTLTFGMYPLVSLKQARDKLVEANRVIQTGVNPVVQKKVVKESQVADSLGSFEVVAREWFERKKIGKVESYSSRIWGRVEDD